MKVLSLKGPIFFIVAGILVLLSACNRDQNIYFNGYIEGKYTYISAPVSGQLMKLYVRRGDEVDKASLLFKLDANPDAFILDESKANLRASQFSFINQRQPTMRPAELAETKALILQEKANVRYSQTQLKRTEALFNNHHISQQDLDLSIQKLNVYKAQLQQYQAQLRAEELPLGRKQTLNIQKATVLANQALLRKAKWLVDEKEAKAPISGVIFETYYRVGEQVPAFKPVVSILQPKDIKAIFFVPEPKLSQIKIGQSVYLQCDNCKKAVKATISYISPQAEYTPPVIYSEQSRSKLVFKVKARFSHQLKTELKPGLPVEIHLVPPANRA